MYGDQRAKAAGRPPKTSAYAIWKARARKRKSTMLPSCGWSQLRLVVGIGPDVQPIDVLGVEQRLTERRVLGQAGSDQRRTDRVEHLVLRALDHGREGEHVFLLGDGGVGRVAEDDRRPQIVAALLLDQPAVGLMRRGHVVDPGFFRVRHR